MLCTQTHPHMGNIIRVRKQVRAQHTAMHIIKIHASTERIQVLGIVRFLLSLFSACSLPSICTFNCIIYFSGFLSMVCTSPFDYTFTALCFCFLLLVFCCCCSKRSWWSSVEHLMGHFSSAASQFICYVLHPTSEKQHDGDNQWQREISLSVRLY